MGERLDKMNERERDRFRANHVGYVFQRFNLFPFLNAYENVALSLYFSGVARPKNSRLEIEALLTKLNLSKADCMKSVENLSIGQQQRVAIARSLIKAGLLIADEPTSSLDEKNRNQFMSVLLDLITEQNTTLLLVSHDPSLRQHFSRVEALADIHKKR